MRIHEGRGCQPPAGIDFTESRRLDRGRDIRDQAIDDGDVVALSPIGQIGAAQEKIERQGLLPYPVVRASGRGRNRAPSAAIDPVDNLFDVAQEAPMKWVMWFILACLGAIAIVLGVAWALGWLAALEQNLDI